MARGMILVVFAASLLASAPPLASSDLLGAVTGLLTPVTGLTNEVLEAVVGSNDSNGLLGDLLGSVVNLLTSVSDKLTSSLTTVADTLGKTLESGVSQPLTAATQLVTSVTAIANPSTISKGLFSALAPLLNAINNLAKLLVGIVECLIKIIVGNLIPEILKGVAEAITCAKPLVKDVGKVTQEVGSVVGGTAGIAGAVLDNVTTCITRLSNTLDFGKVFKCLTDNAAQGLTDVTGLISKATPVVSDALQTALGVPQCIQNVLAKLIKKALDLLGSLLTCAASKGINTTVPNFPSIGPNFTVVANKALATINDITSSAVGAQSPASGLMVTIKKLQLAVAKLDPVTVGVAVNNTIKGIQEAIDTIKNSLNETTPEIVACFSQAQTAVDQLLPEALRSTTSCAATIIPVATKLVEEATDLNVKLDTYAANAGVNAYTDCSVYVLAMDDSAEKCFGVSIVETRLTVIEQLKTVTDVIQEANTLSEKAEKCSSNSLIKVDKDGQEIVAKLKGCLASQGVTNKPKNLTEVILAGQSDVAKLVINMGDSLTTVNSASTNVKGSFDFIKSINADALQRIVATSVLKANSTVTLIAKALADNGSNPALEACSDATVNFFAQLATTAVQQATDNCVTNNAAKIAQLFEQISAEQTALQNKFATAGQTSLEQCKNSVSITAAQNCFLNFRVSFIEDVNQALDRIKNIADKTQIDITDMVACINLSEVQTSDKVDSQLTKYELCLAAQGINTTVPRP